MSPVQCVWLSSSGGFESHTIEVQWLLHMNNQWPVIHQEQHKCTDILIFKNTLKKLKRLQHLFTTCPFFFVCIVQHSSQNQHFSFRMILPYSHAHIPSKLYDYYTFAVDRGNYIEEIQTRWTACKTPTWNEKLANTTVNELTRLIRADVLL